MVLGNIKICQTIQHGETKMNKILITGGTGLVGSTINGDIHLGSADGDLRDMSVVNSIFEKYKPTHVVHCAAKVGGVY